MGCPETSVTNYHYSLRNNPEECSSLLNRISSVSHKFLVRCGYCCISTFANENGAATHYQNPSSIFSVKTCGRTDTQYLHRYTFVYTRPEKGLWNIAWGEFLLSSITLPLYCECWWLRAVSAGDYMLWVLVTTCCECWWLHTVSAGDYILWVLVTTCCECWWLHAVSAGDSILQCW